MNTSIINIAGYSNITGARPIFVRKAKLVPGAAGTQSIIELRKSKNAEFIDAHGEYFFSVGSTFLRLPNEEQLAYIANELILAGFEDEAAATFIPFDQIEERAELGAELDYEADGFVDSELYRLLILSGLFGRKVAYKVISANHKRMMRTAKAVCDDVSKLYAHEWAEKNAVKDAKRANARVLKGVRAMDKAEAKELKADVKARRRTERMERKAERAAVKEAKKAAKAANAETPDLEAAAAAI